MKKYLKLEKTYWAIAFLAGMFSAMGYPNDILPANPICSIIAFVLLFLALDIFNPNKFKQKVIASIFFSIGSVIFGMNWIAFTLKEFGGIAPPFNYILTLLFFTIAIPQLWFFLIAIKLSFRKKEIYKSKYFTLGLAAFLVTLDILTPQQFPTYPGSGWLVLSPYLIFAQLFSVHFYSFLTYWPALAIVKFIQTKKIDFLPVVFLMIVIIISFVTPITFNKDRSLNIRMVQGNIGNAMKLAAEQGSYRARSLVFKSYKELSLSPSNSKIDLIIWPETSYSRLLDSKSIWQGDNVIPRLLNDVVEKSGADLIVGTYDRSNNGDSFFEDQYNSIFHLGLKNDQVQLLDIYHKMKLIPFGETLPFGSFNKIIGKYIDNISYFAKGTRYTLFKTANFSYITAICYEVLFPDFIRTYLNKVKEKPNFLINISNDSWYGETIEPYQHLHITKWRAIEFNIPIVRVTNTGFSSAFYPTGEESKRLLLGDRAVNDLKLYAGTKEVTIFQKYGYIPFILLVASFGVILFFCRGKSLFK